MQSRHGGLLPVAASTEFYMPRVFAIFVLLVSLLGVLIGRQRVRGVLVETA
jgi:hypothetical protein